MTITFPTKVGPRQNQYNKMAIVKCNTITGEVIKIDEEKLLPRRSAYALLANKNGELLVEDPSEEGGKYWFIGGGIENNEDPKEALKREALEEAGMEIKIEKLISTLEYCYYHNKLLKYFKNHAEFYLCNLVRENNKVKKGVKIRWLKINKIDENKFHTLIVNVVRKLKRELGSLDKRTC